MQFPARGAVAGAVAHGGPPRGAQMLPKDEESMLCRVPGGAAGVHGVPIVSRAILGFSDSTKAMLAKY